MNQNNEDRTTEICSICLEKQDHLANILQTDLSNLTFHSKLTMCIPEVVQDKQHYKNDKYVNYFICRIGRKIT